MSMQHQPHSPEDYQTLVELGIPAAEVNGYQITDGDQQILNEYYSNQREQGFAVPEEYIPTGVSRKEMEMRYQELSMYETELERTGKAEIVDDVAKWERRGYEEDELDIDEAQGDYVPEFEYNNRRIKERQENETLQKKKHYSKKRKNDESSRKLVEMLEERTRRMEEKRRQNEQKSREIVEKLKRKENENEERD